MEEIVYLNGSLVPRSQACLSVFDHGFLYGAGLFETVRAYNGKMPFLERHLSRLLTASRVLGLAGSLDKLELEKACMDTLEANNLEDARLRLTVSRGEAGPFSGSVQKATLLVTAIHYSPPPADKYEKGFKAGVASFEQFSRSPLAELKSTSYLSNVLARMEAEAAGLDEALFLNERGHITEGTTSNIFFINSSSGLVTPAVEGGLLAGVTRQVVLEIAGSLGIDAVETEVRLADLKGFTEAFLTSSMMELMPLVEVRDSDGRVVTIGSGKPGPVTKRLMAAYKEVVLKEVSG